MKIKSTLALVAVVLIELLVIIMQVKISHARAAKIDNLQNQLNQANADAQQSRTRTQALQAEIDKLNQAAAVKSAAVSAAVAKNPQWANQELPADVAAAINQQ